MAGGMKIDWHGVEQLTMAIKGAGSKVRDQSGKVIKNKTEKLKKKAQELAPKDTEFLKDHIKSSYPDQLEGHVKGEAAYEGYQEYGKDKRVLTFVELRFKVELRGEGRLFCEI